jgi:hypothetical protein
MSQTESSLPPRVQAERTAMEVRNLISRLSPKHRVYKDIVVTIPEEENPKDGMVMRFTLGSSTDSNASTIRKWDYYPKFRGFIDTICLPGGRYVWENVITGTL